VQEFRKARSRALAFFLPKITENPRIEIIQNSKTITTWF